MPRTPWTSESTPPTKTIMSTIHQAQQAMGPVYLAWAKQASGQSPVDNHCAMTTFAGGSNIFDRTLPVAKVFSKQICSTLIDYLEAHGPATNAAIVKGTGITKKQITTLIASNIAKARLRKERVVRGGVTTMLYWVDEKPPAISERSQIIQLIQHFSDHPWTPVQYLGLVGKERKSAYANVTNLLKQKRLIAKKNDSGVIIYKVKK